MRNRQSPGSCEWNVLRRDGTARRCRYDALVTVRRGTLAYDLCSTHAIHFSRTTEANDWAIEEVWHAVEPQPRPSGRQCLPHS